MAKYSDSSKDFRYTVRDETEQSIKDLGIDRANFHEVGKLDYERVIKQFYYTFIDYKNHPDIHLHYVWLHFRKGLEHKFCAQHGYHVNDWCKFIHMIDSEIIPKENRPAEYYLINDCAWVYEGKLPEILRVLEDAGMLEDFYILPKREKFDWVVCYCGDGDSLVIWKVRENGRTDRA